MAFVCHLAFFRLPKLLLLLSSSCSSSEGILAQAKNGDKRVSSHIIFSPPMRWLNMHSWGAPSFFPFQGRGWGCVWSSIIFLEKILVFSIIFVCVPQIPQCVFQDGPNSITLASHIICPRKSNLIIKVHKMRGGKMRSASILVLLLLIAQFWRRLW